MNAGAYAFSMASQYNSRPRPAEVLVRKGEVDIIRERKPSQTFYPKQNLPVRLLK